MCVNHKKKIITIIKRRVLESIKQRSLPIFEKKYVTVQMLPSIGHIIKPISSMRLAGGVSYRYLILLTDAYGDRGWVGNKFLIPDF